MDELQMTEIKFGTVQLGELETVLCIAEFSGQLYVGNGENRQAALEDVFKRVYPEMKGFKYGPAAAWSKHLMEE